LEFDKKLRLILGSKKSGSLDFRLSRLKKYQEKIIVGRRLTITKGTKV
jgi:hypothetical protein